MHSATMSARFFDSNRPIGASYDRVVANILSNPLKVLAPAICGHVRAGGELALSGILAEQAEEIDGHLQRWIPLHVADSREGWVCLSGRKAGKLRMLTRCPARDQLPGYPRAAQAARRQSALREVPDCL